MKGLDETFHLAPHPGQSDKKILCNIYSRRTCAKQSSSLYLGSVQRQQKVVLEEQAAGSAHRWDDLGSAEDSIDSNVYMNYTGPA